ncbi:MAG: hypothetical protein J6R42_06125 [Clostridia bacterium]|nr:hypothetical protein [Clostridia bacterium]
MLYLIDDDFDNRTIVRDMLYRKGLFSDDVSTIELGEKLKNDERAICVFLSPATSPMLEEIIEVAHQKNAVCIGVYPEAGTYHDNLIPFVLSQSHLLCRKLLAILKENCFHSYVHLQHDIFSDDLTEDTAKVLGLPLELTHTERMIFRYLLYTKKEGAKIEDLERYCLKPNTELTRGNIATHIRKINLKLDALFHLRVITFHCGAYRLMEDMPIPHTKRIYQ